MSEPDRLVRFVRVVTARFLAAGFFDVGFFAADFFFGAGDRAVLDEGFSGVAVAALVGGAGAGVGVGVVGAGAATG